MNKLLLIWLLLFSFTIAAQVEEKEEVVSFIDNSNSTLPYFSKESDKIIVQEVQKKYARRGKIGGRYGFYIATKGWFIPPIYEKLPARYTALMEAKKNGKVGIIDGDNNVIVPFDYDEIETPKRAIKLSSGKVHKIVKKGKLKGILNEQATFIFLPIYSSLSFYNNGKYCLGNKEKGYGMVNLEGEVEIPLVYESPLRRKEGMFFHTVKDDKSGVIDSSGNIIAPFIYDRIKVSKGKIKYFREGKCGVMNGQYKEVTKPLYTDLIFQANGTAIAYGNGKVGALNTNYELVVPTKYWAVESMSSRYFLVKKEKAFGCIDTLGIEVLPFSFTRIRKGPGDLLMGLKQGENLYAVYNEKGEEVYPSTFEVVHNFLEDYIKVKKAKSGKFALLNDKGELVTPFIYDEIRKIKKVDFFEKQIIYAERDGYAGFLHYDGTEYGDFIKMKNADLPTVKSRKILEEVKGKWYGREKIAEKDYLCSITFDENKVVRTLYYPTSDSICEIQSEFTAFVSNPPNINMRKTQKASRDICQDIVEKQTQIQKSSFFKRKYITMSGHFYRIGLKDFYQVSDDMNNTEIFDKLLTTEKLNLIEKDLEKKAIRTKYQNFPVEFDISPFSNEVNIVGCDYSGFGTIRLKKEEYFLVPAKWKREKEALLLATLKNVNYVGKKGKDKKGDLEIFTSSVTNNIYFQELVR